MMWNMDLQETCQRFQRDVFHSCHPPVSNKPFSTEVAALCGAAVEGKLFGSWCFPSGAAMRGAEHTFSRAVGACLGGCPIPVGTCSLLWWSAIQLSYLSDLCWFFLVLRCSKVSLVLKIENTFEA